MGRGKRENGRGWFEGKPTVAGINSMRKQRIRGRRRERDGRSPTEKEGERNERHEPVATFGLGKRSRSEKKEIERKCKRKEGRPRNGTDSSREGGGQEALSFSLSHKPVVHEVGLVAESDSSFDVIHSCTMGKKYPKQLI